MRGTTAAPESFSTKSSGQRPLKPDPENPQHQKQIKRAQQILGALLLLSARTRPDLSYAVAMAASVQTRDLRDLEVRLRHLLQYVSSHPHLGLYYPYPTSNYRSLETFTDASFAPSGSHSHQGFTVLFKVGHSQHLLHWNSTRQKLVPIFCRGRAHCSDVRVQGNEKFSTLALRERCRSYPDSPVRQSGRPSDAREAILEDEAHKYQRRSLETGQGREGNSDNLCVYPQPGGRSTDEPTSPQLNKGFYPKWGLVTLDASSGGVADSERQRPSPVSREKKNK